MFSPSPAGEGEQLAEQPDQRSAQNGSDCRLWCVTRSGAARYHTHQ